MGERRDAQARQRGCVAVAGIRDPAEPEGVAASPFIVYLARCHGDAPADEVVNMSRIAWTVATVAAVAVLLAMVLWL